MLKKKVLSIIGLVVVVIGIFAYFKKPAKSFAPPVPVLVPTEVVKLGFVRKKENFIGRVRTSQSVTLSSEVPGRITFMMPDGSSVRTGDILIRLDDSEAIAKLQSAEGSKDKELNKANTIRGLFQEGYRSENHLKEAEAEFKMANGRYLETKANLEKHCIRAPFSGIIGLQRQFIGSVVGQNTPLVSISNLDHMQVEFVISEATWQAMGGADRIKDAEIFVTVEGDSLPNSAVFAAYETVVDSATDGVTVRAWVNNDESGKTLTPGQFANVVVDSGTKENVIVIPEGALQIRQGTALVYKVVNNLAIEVAVRVGIKDGSRAEIVEGLKVGDVIIVAGQYRLSDGQPVEIEKKGKENATK